MEFGKPRTYPIHTLEVGDTVEMPAPTPADKKRIARNISQYGIRHDRWYTMRTNKQTGITTIKRLR